MGWDLEAFSGIGLTSASLETLLSDHEGRRVPRLARMWRYYRNRSDGIGALPAQAEGLPRRLGGRGGAWETGAITPLRDDRTDSPAEVVIENDIAWRVHSMVDFMFGKPVRLVSQASDERTRARVETALEAAWEASGGIALVQDIGLMGHVYGHVDLLVRAGEFEGDGGGSTRAESADESEELAALAQSAARAARVELIEPTRGAPVLSAEDFRSFDGYVVRFRMAKRGPDQKRDLSAPPAWSKPGPLLTRWLRGERPEARGGRGEIVVTEIHGGAGWQRYEDHGDGPRLVASGPNRVSPGRTPVAHIQNLSAPFEYEGVGEVEPLIPLQDELNTRLSDRASRVTLQSFKMYLAKGMENFGEAGVGPGRVWATDNPDASVEPFGGSADAPGEAEHIEQVREAMDKMSAVPPLAGGVVRARIGNLSSENALRVTLMGLLTKTDRKRVTYGRGLAEASRLVLGALHEAGVLETSPSDRQVRVVWPDPLPRDEREALSAARAKVELGVDRRRVLAELGYAAGDPGVV